MIRYAFYLWTRVWFPDVEAQDDIERFYTDFVEKLSDVEIRPGRKIHVLNAEPNDPKRALGKPMIVVVHGSCSRMGHLHNQIRHFERAGYHVIAFDMFGCGRSAKPIDGDYGIKSHYDDLLAVISLYTKQYGCKAVVIGHSAGASMCLSLATTPIEYNIAGVVALAPIDFIAYRTAQINTRRTFSLPSSLLWLIRPVMTFLVRHNFFGKNAKTRMMRMEAEGSARNPVHMYKNFWTNFEISMLPDPIAAPKAHILIMVGSVDKITPAKGARRNFQALTEKQDDLKNEEKKFMLRFQEIPNCGHCLGPEEPDIVNEAIDKFLADL